MKVEDELTDAGASFRANLVCNTAGEGTILVLNQGGGPTNARGRTHRRYLVYTLPASCSLPGRTYVSALDNHHRSAGALHWPLEQQQHAGEKDCGCVTQKAEEDAGWERKHEMSSFYKESWGPMTLVFALRPASIARVLVWLLMAIVPGTL
nr:hypothetical protein CFP56_41445 [Quercus suber]